VTGRASGLCQLYTFIFIHHNGRKKTTKQKTPKEEKQLNLKQLSSTDELSSTAGEGRQLIGQSPNQGSPAMEKSR